MSTPSTRRRHRALAVVLLATLATALVPLASSSAATARCRGARAMICGVHQTITFPAVANVRVDAGPVALHAFSTVDEVTRVAARDTLPVPSDVYYTSETPATCTISGATAVLVAVGTCTVTAHADANNLGGGMPVLAATPVSRSFQVRPAVGPTLSVPTGAALSARRVTVTATSDSEDAITVASKTPRVCQVTGRSVTLHAAGRCELTATQGESTGSASFPVWPTPELPGAGRPTQVLNALGRGEDGYAVAAGPADVCRASADSVVLIDGGTCRVTVRHAGAVVRTDRVKVVVPAKPAAPQHAMDLGATVYFAFDSAKLSHDGRAALRRAAATLRKADLVVVYGHTYGPGKNSKHSRALAARRAAAVVAYLDALGVQSKVSEVAMAMEQPVSTSAWKNRRAEVYYR